MSHLHVLTPYSLSPHPLACTVKLLARSTNRSFAQKAVANGNRPIEAPDSCPGATHAMVEASSVPSRSRLGHHLAHCQGSRKPGRRLRNMAVHARSHLQSPQRRRCGRGRQTHGEVDRCEAQGTQLCRYQCTLKKIESSIHSRFFPPSFFFL